MQKKLTISVVIPSWNSEAQLKENLPAVFAAAKKVAAEIIVVDDASRQDHSIEYLNSLGKQIRFIKNTKNQGFGATVNQGVKIAKGEIVVLLNTDVRPASDCFEKVRGYFIDTAVYAVGFNSGEGSMGGEWRDGLFHHFKVDEPTKKTGASSSLWASGGQAAFSRKKWLELGGMDSLYRPFYWEDVDMGYCAWKRGWQVLWAVDCHVVHDHKKSVITGSFTKQFITQVATRNQFLFIWKNISDKKLLIKHLLKLPLYLLRYPAAVGRALLMLPHVLTRRQHESRFWKLTDRDILSVWAK